MSDKITQHPEREKIDQWIASGLPFAEIEKLCKSQLKLNVSHMTIKRYCDNTSELQQRRNQAQSANDLAQCEAISVNDWQDESVIAIDTSQLPTESSLVRDYARETLNRIYLNQLLIVEHKQKLFMQGQGRYPQNEINGLKSILACLGYVVDGKDGTFKDVDK
jgi:hypothetical protein